MWGSLGYSSGQREPKQEKRGEAEVRVGAVPFSMGESWGMKGDRESYGAPKKTIAEE